MYKPIQIAYLCAVIILQPSFGQEPIATRVELVWDQNLQTDTPVFEAYQLFLKIKNLERGEILATTLFPTTDVRSDESIRTFTMSAGSSIREQKSFVKGVVSQYGASTTAALELYRRLRKVVSQEKMTPTTRIACALSLSCFCNESGLLLPYIACTNEHCQQIDVDENALTEINPLYDALEGFIVKSRDQEKFSRIAALKRVLAKNKHVDHSDHRREARLAAIHHRFNRLPKVCWNYPFDVPTGDQSVAMNATFEIPTTLSKWKRVSASFSERDLYDGFRVGEFDSFARESYRRFFSDLMDDTIYFIDESVENTDFGYAHKDELYVMTLQGMNCDDLLLISHLGRGYSVICDQLIRSGKMPTLSQVMQESADVATLHRQRVLGQQIWDYVLVTSRLRSEIATVFQDRQETKKGTGTK